jgi:hypothetical protein
VLRDLDPELIDYKGLGRYRPLAVAYLAPWDDGAPIPVGVEPGQASL